MRTVDVLIDTWWNVNDFFTDEIENLLSFNRYMVECEYYILYDVN